MPEISEKCKSLNKCDPRLPLFSWRKNNNFVIYRLWWWC